MAVPSWASDPLTGAFGAGPVNYVRGILQPKVDPNAWRTDPLSGAIGSGPASVLRALTGFAGRSAAAEERQGPYVPDRIKNAPPTPTLPPAGGTPVPPAPGRPTPVVQAADDTYRQLLSQYGAPGIQQLAGMTSLPTGFTPTGGTQAASLKDYYAAQTMQGSANLGSIISEMGYKGPMAEWAKANPMLAQREYDKRFGGATLASAVQPTGEVRGMPQAISGLDTSKMMPTAAMQGTTFPGQGQGPVFNPSASFSDQSSFSSIANSVPAPPGSQLNVPTGVTGGQAANINPQNYSSAFTPGPREAAEAFTKNFPSFFRPQ